MEREKGGIKLITLIGIILLAVILAFGIVIYNKYQKSTSEIGNKNEIRNQIPNEIVENIDENDDKEDVDEIKDEDQDEDRNGTVISEVGNFSVQFLRLENNKQNMIYSPLSIKYALKMLEEGAEGNTKTQIEKVIGNETLTRYKNIDKVLSLANSMYIKDTYSKYLMKDYKDTLLKKYDAEIKYDDFLSVDNINNWIERKTLGQIKNMLSQIHPDTRLMLINALAIDMEWKSKFEDKDTHGQEFYLENGEKMIATTMTQTTSSKDVSYYIGEDITALSLDLKEYDDNQLEFIAIMPEEDLEKYLENLTLDKVNKVISRLKSASKSKYGVTVKIPKFSFDYDLKLKNNLVNLGITDAFKEENADFSNMATKPLYVGDVLHKANIDFSEKGVKAAAVTVVLMFETTALLDDNKHQPEIININKPFVFFIRDKESKEIWFVGTLYEPNSWEDDKSEYQGKY